MEASLSGAPSQLLRCGSAHSYQVICQRTSDEEDRKFLLRKGKEWTKLAIKKELEIRASARAAA
jgi:hypothetical protein